MQTDFLMLILFTLIFTGLSVTTALFQIRNDLRNGIVCENIDEFLFLVKTHEPSSIFKKRINRFVKGNFVYTLVQAGTLYSVVVADSIDDRLPAGTTVITRSSQVQ